MAAERAVEDLGVAVSDRLREDLVEAFADAGGDSGPDRERRARGDARGAASAAASASGSSATSGSPAASCCAAFLERRGLLTYFDGWSFSDEVGVYKPDPAIFARALTSLGDVPADRALHVGDLRRTDVAGARAIGMTSVRYRGANDDDEDLPEADHVIDHHGQLLAILDRS